MIIYTVEWPTGYDYNDIFGYYSTKEKAEETLKSYIKDGYTDAFISDIEVE